MRSHTIKLIARFIPALAVGVLVLAATATVPAGSAAAAEAKQQPSAKLAKPLHDAQELLKAKKYQDAIAKLKEADATAGKTPYDQHVINDFLTNAYINTQNYPEAAKYMEAELDDGFTTEGEKPQKVRALAEINYQIKNYDKAIEFGNRAIKGGFADERMKILIGQAYYLKGDYKGTQKFVDGLVDAEIKAGETPKKDTLLLDFSACQKLNDPTCSTKAIERLVQYYPSPDYWSQLLFDLRQQTSTNEPDLLQVYRLMAEVDVLKSPDDYNEMASLAIEQGSPGEAVSILERGIAKGVFTEPRAKDRNQRLLESAKKAAAVDQASLAKTTAEADAAPTGQKNIGVGLAYFGYGQYDKAVDQLTKGLSKGGVKSEVQARLLLGIAQLKAGHKDDAIKTFKAVKGDATLERLATLWTLHAKQA
jgi:tetratricopeptide (TPR) repeat protein